MQLSIQITVCLKLLLWGNGIKGLLNLFLGMQTVLKECYNKWKKKVAILDEFTLLSLSSYFVVYFFFQLNLILSFILYYNIPNFAFTDSNAKVILEEE